MPIDEATVEAVVAAVKGSRKYRDTHEATIRLLAVEAVSQHKKAKPAEKAVRKRLHSIMAPYLGDPDYELAAQRLSELFAAGADGDAVRAACADLMHTHLSTRERLPILEQFYGDIFAVTGPPRRLLDLGCGLNPLALRWMGLPPGAEYWAYDIHEPRVAFLNQYFTLEGLPPLAVAQDIALRPPTEPGDVALFLKEVPRFERNYPDHGRALLRGLAVRHLVVSFPTVSTHGGRNLTNRYRDFFHDLIEGTGWPVEERLFDSEVVFIADKGAPDPA
jgi:16S rRNA (guanine(1405)-N(7))-methyltransferase